MPADPANRVGGEPFHVHLAGPVDLEGAVHRYDWPMAFEPSRAEAAHTAGEHATGHHDWAFERADENIAEPTRTELERRAPRDESRDLRANRGHRRLDCRCRDFDRRPLDLADDLDRTRRAP